MLFTGSSDVIALQTALLFFSVSAAFEYNFFFFTENLEEEEEEEEWQQQQ